MEQRCLTWNVLLTSYESREKDLLDEVAGLGSFERTGFRNTLAGTVEDVHAFLDTLGNRHHPSLSRVVPIETWFESSPEHVEEKLKKAVLPFVARIAKGETFCVRVERRGMKGKLSSHELELEVGSYVWELLRDRHGTESKVNLTDPDKLIRIETLARQFGLGMITKAMRQRYPFVK